MDGRETSVTAADLLISSIADAGVNNVFGMPGDQLTPLFSALFKHRERIKTIHPRNEQAASYMAFGYARATGTEGVYAVPPGPGLLNSLAGLAVGYASSTPLLCLAGQIPSSHIGQGKGMLHELPNQSAIYSSLVKWSACVKRSEDVSGLVGTAFENLRSGRKRPVVLELPPDVMSSRATTTKTNQVDSESYDGVDREMLERALYALRLAKKPLIVVGGGAIGAEGEVGQLAEILQAPVVANSAGRGIMSARSFLSFTWPAGHELWKSADVVLALGTRLAQPRFQWGVDSRMTLIRVDVDELELVSGIGNQISFLGPVIEVAKSLADGLKDHAAESRRTELRSLKDEYLQKFRQLTPQAEFVAAIRDALPEDGILVDELTQVGYACRYSFPVYSPRTYITSGYQGALGYGLAAAMGAKVGCPRKEVISINGDGGFFYGASELSTAVQHGIGIVAIVFNDGSFGNIAREQVQEGIDIATTLHNPDIVRYAESFGARAFRVGSPNELLEKLTSSFGHSCPTVIEVRVGSMPSPWHLLRLPRVRGD